MSMTTYKLTNSIDGNSRLDVCLKVRMTLWDMADHIVAQLTSDLSNPDVDRDATPIPRTSAINACLSSKRAAMKIVQRSVEQQGNESQHYFVSDHDWGLVVNAVHTRLSVLWSAA